MRHRASSSGHRRRLHGRARRVTIDLDPTDDPTHGAQQLSFFNGHYGNWCYLPQLAFLSFDREAEQYLCAAVLRPGNAVAADGTVGLLCRLLPLLRSAFPRARFLVRLDGGFATPEIFGFPGCGTGTRLRWWRWRRMRCYSGTASPRWRLRGRRARRATGPSTSTPTVAMRLARGAMNAGWVIKAEVVRLGEREPRDNPRFVVTNLRQTPRFIYEKVYCARGDIENRIKELLHGLEIDRTSCCHFGANQLRVLLTAAAYVLMQELRLRAARTACARMQVTWLRARLLTLGVHVLRSARRLVLHLPARHAVPRRVAAHCTRPRCARRIAPPAPHPLRSRDGIEPLTGGAVAAQPSAPAIAHGRPANPVAARPWRCPRPPFTHRTHSLGARIRPFKNNAGFLVHC